MPSRTILSIGFTIIACVAAACATPDEGHEYALQGQILSVAPSGMEASIKHEEIKGLMAAMTMTYKVRDAQQFAGLKPGDVITSTLVVVSNDAYLTGVKKVGEAPLEKAPEEKAPSPASSGFEPLTPAEAVPNTPFVDQNGRKRYFASFMNSTLLVTSIYTRCQPAVFSPLMDPHFTAIQDKLKADWPLENVHLATVRFDPTTDTPLVLKKYAQTRRDDPKYWTFPTGDRDEIDRFAARFGVAVTRELSGQRGHRAQSAHGPCRQGGRTRENLHGKRVDAPAGLWRT